MGKFSECHYCVVVNKDRTNNEGLTEVIVNRQCTDGNGNPDKTFYEVFNLKTKRNEYYPESSLELKHEYATKINSDEMRKERAEKSLCKQLIGEDGCVDIVENNESEKEGLRDCINNNHRFLRIENWLGGPDEIVCMNCGKKRYED